MSRGSVYDWIRSTFDAWGMPPSVAETIISESPTWRSPAQAVTAIRELPAYKERFAGNIARAENGYGMLDEGTYLQMEKQYREAMHAAGIPEGFSDSPKDFAEFIANDVSVQEVTARAELAGQLAVTKNPQLWKELESRGLEKGDVAAYLLNPDKALPLIQRKIDRAEMGAVARDTGMNFAKGNKFENKLVGKGISSEEAKAAMETAADERGDVNNLARVYGEKGFSDKGLVKQELGIGGKKTRKAKQRLKGLASQERATFSGRAGGAQSAFGSTDY